VVELGGRFLGVEKSGNREGEAEVMKINGKHDLVCSAAREIADSSGEV
jgi:hypothetical protein